MLPSGSFSPQARQNWISDTAVSGLYLTYDSALSRAGTGGDSGSSLVQILYINSEPAPARISISVEFIYLKDIKVISERMADA